MTTKDIIDFGEKIGVYPYAGDRRTPLERHKRRIYVAIGKLSLSVDVAKRAVGALEDVANWEDEDVLRVLRAYNRTVSE